jgi:uncharacterized membrane protein
MQNRFKSPIAWLSIALLIVNQFALHELVGLDENGLHMVVEALTTILIAFGILNNPTKKDTF